MKLVTEAPRGQAEGADRLARLLQGRRTMSTKWTFVRVVYRSPKRSSRRRRPIG
ncbi:hypothetical protein SELSPUOL_00124 [Selenomonas sputigena ATCC 35185]|uniref:Uncharacterized protein n=1 Tax=Selenomonas sputigena (strain ATCC 35185 / DSM 20758 / CCUG 44933 / VPI D19B-28) TaxID=546271 RepID=C9LRQ7_SELS3|nr:hypothetical protein SELSPUOL_00124 [Selenomonas sputigena ATCC 35185]